MNVSTVTEKTSYNYQWHYNGLFRNTSRPILWVLLIELDGRVPLATVLPSWDSFPFLLNKNEKKGWIASKRQQKSCFEYNTRSLTNSLDPLLVSTHSSRNILLSNSTGTTLEKTNHKLRQHFYFANISTAKNDNTFTFFKRYALKNYRIQSLSTCSDNFSSRLKLNTYVRLVPSIQEYF